MIEMSSGVIYGLFAMFVILGVLLGLRRGLVKSVIRFATVIITCVLVVFLVQPITTAILTADMSSAGFVLGDVPVTNLNDTIVNYIRTLSGVAQLIAASPTLLAVITAIPAMIVNMLLFVVLFFIIKGILYFVDIIINRLVIGKDSLKPKRRIWGAVVGGVQGVICFLFVFIPIAGTMNMIDETIKLVDINADTVQSASLSSVSLSGVDTIAVEDGDSLQMDEFAGVAGNASDAYQDIFIIKAFNAIGYKAITNAVYDKMTTIEISEDNKTTLRSEVKVVAKVFNGYQKLKDVDISYFSAQNQKQANQLIDDAFSSPVIGGVATEVVGGLANAWTASSPSEFAGIAKPQINENLVNTFDVLLISLKNNSAEGLKNDLKAVIGTIKVAADYHVTENINAGDADALVNVFGQDGCMEAIIGQLSSGKSTKYVIPGLIDFGLSYGYTAVGLTDSEVDIQKSADQVNWNTEKVILGDLFEGVSATYLSTKQEGELINNLDFDAFAKVLNSLRASQLLSDISQEISVNLLSSKLALGIDVSNLLSYIQNDTKYAEIDFGVMLRTFKSSANIATDMKEIISGGGDVTELNPSDVSTFLGGLTSDETTKEVLKDLAGEENLKSAGVDDSTAKAVSGLVDVITDYDMTDPGAVAVPETDEDMAKESAAVEKLVAASTGANNLGTDYIFSNDDVTAKAKMIEFIDSITSSKFVYAATIGQGERLGFKSGENSCLSEHEQAWLIEVLDEDQGKPEPKYSALQCVEIAEMFGLEYVPA